MSKHLSHKKQEKPPKKKDTNPYMYILKIKNKNFKQNLIFL